jgi:hypothetical protein
MNTQITEEEYITELLTNLPPKSWDDICEEEEEFLRICEEEEERERLEDLEEEEERERLEDLEEEEERERLEVLEEDQKEVARRHEDLEEERKREERELKELTVIRKALLADGKYVLEEGEILE